MWLTDTTHRRYAHPQPPQAGARVAVEAREGGAGIRFVEICVYMKMKIW